MYLQDNIRRLKISFAIFVAIVAIGTVGYMILTNIGFIDALYMTVITIATVGYKEVAELDNAGKLFTIFLIIAGTGAVAFFASQIVEYAIEGEVRKIFTRKAMLKRIKKMKGHIIICGFGRMGRIIVEEIKGKIDFIIASLGKSNNPSLFVITSTYLRSLFKINIIFGIDDKIAFSLLSDSCNLLSVIFRSRVF